MNIRAKKSLGQNFLKDSGIAAKIIVAAELSKNDTVLEVGPGTGVLTGELIKSAGRVIAVEKDKRLYELLCEKFQSAKNLELVNADILAYNLPAAAYKLVANIPYNISGAFFRKFLLAENRPSFIVVMVQKEVGERLLGKNKSILSLASELYGSAEKICDVPPESFNPRPNVWSSVIKLICGAREKDEEKILRIAKIGFSSRRKKLISNLSTGLDIKKAELADIFERLGLGENIRAEELAKDDWLKLAQNIKY